MAAPRLISCDEAGFSGPKVLEADQPIFAYAANDLNVEEAAAFVAELRNLCRPALQGDELKSRVLRRRNDWTKLAEFAVGRLKGRYLFVVVDKLLALSGNAFEYLVEPVLERNSGLFYSHGLHRLVANSVHRTLLTKGDTAETVAGELEAFMRSFDPALAPTIFSAPPSLPDEAEVLEQLLRFSRGYKDRINARSEHLRDPDGVGKWVLDLTQTCLGALTLEGFGHRYSRIDLLCDDSKPLRAMAGFFDSFVGRTETIPVGIGPYSGTWTLNLAGPVRFGSSKDHATLQVSDLVAGLAAEMYGPAEKSRVEHLKPEVERHLHKNHILPASDDGTTDPFTRAVNLHVLQILARRADTNRDSLDGMADNYKTAITRYAQLAKR